MPLSFGFLSPYAPRERGLDTFTRCLANQLAASGHRTGVVGIVETEPYATKGDIGRAAEAVYNGISSAVAALATFDVAVLQYDIGI
jgi:hypothetical protein